jgi:hypothetical protein
LNSKTLFKNKIYWRNKTFLTGRISNASAFLLLTFWAAHSKKSDRALATRFFHTLQANAKRAQTKARSLPQ